jgi:hypothetical protein
MGGYPPAQQQPYPPQQQGGMQGYPPPQQQQPHHHHHHGAALPGGLVPGQLIQIYSFATGKSVRIREDGVVDANGGQGKEAMMMRMRMKECVR